MPKSQALKEAESWLGAISQPAEIQSLMLRCAGALQVHASGALREPWGGETVLRNNVLVVILPPER